MYLEGSADKLVFDPLVKENKSGRPKNLERIDKLIETIENKIITEKEEKNQKEKELITSV